jgi:hypothetical protein
MTLSSHASTIAKSMLLVSFFNNSPSLWLQLLREEMIRCNGNVVALISPVATRWTSTWISAVSVLQCKAAFSSVLTSQNGRERLSIAESSNSPKFAALKAVVDIIRSNCFWDDLSSHLDALVPTIESSLVMQGGSATLADVLYCFARQFQYLSRGVENEVLRKLEKRFAMFELPLLFMYFWLHPKYKTIAEGVLSNGILSMVDVVGWIDGYVKRWCVAGETNTSVAAAVAEWATGCDHWVTIAQNFRNSPENYWNFVRLDSSHAQFGGVKASRHCLAASALKVFRVLPNSADPERAFSELGRMITSSRTSLSNTQSSRMLLIASDYRASEREAEVCAGGSESETIARKMFRTKKKFTNKAEALLRLKEIAQYPAGVAAVSNVPMGGVVFVGESAGVSGSDGGSGSGGGSGSNSGSGTGGDIAADEDEQDNGRGDDGGDIEVASAEGEGKDEIYAAELLDDEATTTLAINNYDGFSGRLAEIVAEFESTCEVDTTIDNVVDGVESDAGSTVGETHLPVLGQYNLGQLPEGNEPDVPQDTKTGFRGLKKSLSELFQEAVVGRLPPLISIGTLN